MDGKAKFLVGEFVPFALPDIGEEEIAEVVDSLRSGWITTGPKAKAFEAQFSALMGNSVQALSVNSATAGLHLALESIGVGPGDWVVTTPYTFTATAEVVRYLGGDVLFADVDSETMNIEPQQIEEVLRKEPRVKAIVPVHFAGQSCEMDEISDLGVRSDIPIIEDAAHALPASYKGRMVGTLSRATVFSFYATKTVTTGEGGMVVTADPIMIERIRTMRLHGINRDVFDRYSTTTPSWYYEVVAPGFKYNMPDIAAALGIHQLRKATKFQQRRQSIAERYTESFRDLPLRVPKVVRPHDVHSWHLYVIQLELEQLCIGRDRFIEMLSARGIGVSVHFIPLHIHPYWRDRYGFQPGDFPQAYGAYTRAISLPIYTRMSDSDVDRVIAAVREIALGNQR